MKNQLRTLILLPLFISCLCIQAQVPKLSSYPSASAVIFLDFDGHTVDGTMWNWNGPVYCAASGFDNTQITTVYNRVAEDFRPFDVNITTDSAQFLAAPLKRRIRAIITASYEWTGIQAGGIAAMGSFTWGDDTPCFVFSSLLKFNTKNIAEASSHEAGHTLGLSHQAVYTPDCEKVTDYYGGQGSGQIGWAPIMGAGYYQNTTQWYNGTNPYGCANYQNDLDMIASKLPYRKDDHANTFTAATLAVFSNNQFIITGVVERSTDQDMIKFAVPATGHFHLEANPFSVGAGNSGSNLDMQVTLYNQTRADSAVYNPGTLLNSVIDTNLVAGTYYLKVEGKGNIFASNYASLGQFKLQAKLTAGVPLPLRVLKLNGRSSGNNHQLNWTIDADEQIIKLQVEMSADGTNFSAVTQTAADARSLLYKPTTAPSVQYRLNVTFDNGKQYYSNIIVLLNSETVAKPQLVSNMINNHTVAITSPGNFNYMVYDMSGKTIRKGQFTNGYNTINMAGVANGMYMIRYSAAGEHWTDKMILQ